jgi:hypothetical protein
MSNINKKTLKPRFQIFRSRNNNAANASRIANVVDKKHQEETSSTRSEKDMLLVVSRSVATFSSFDTDDNLEVNKIPPKICFHMDIFNDHCCEFIHDNDPEIFVGEGGKILFEI